MESALYVGRVVHQRFQPRGHRLSYRVYWIYADLDDLDRLAGGLRLFSLDRFNLVSLFRRDHGARDGGALKAHVVAALDRAGLTAARWRIGLITMPRILGYAFNPLSVYFCRDESGSLRAILYEVSNTFGESHSYLIPVAEDAEPPIRQACAKGFYVSPFLDADLGYRFTVTPPDEKVAIAIDVARGGERMLHAALVGTRRPLTDAALATVFLSHPLVTLKVIAAIHWEALILWLKRIGLRDRTAPPPHPVTIVRPGGDAVC